MNKDLNKEWNKKYPQHNKTDDKKQKLLNRFIDEISSSDNSNIVDFDLIDESKDEDNSSSDKKKIKELEKSLKISKKRCEELREENYKLKSELKNIKRVNYELKQVDQNNKEVIQDNKDIYDKNIEDLNDKIRMHKINSEKLKREIYILQDANKQVKQINGKLKLANNTINQLRDNNKRLIERIKKLQSNEYYTLFFYVLNENEKLNNTINSLLGELRVYKESVERLNSLRKNININRSKNRIDIVNDDSDIEYGYIYRDEYSNWLFLKNANEYYLISNPKRLGKKVRCLAMGKIVDDNKVEVLKVYEGEN